MKQTILTIRTTNPDGKSADIAALCKSVTWSGDIHNSCRSLTYTPVTADADPQFPVAPTELGGSVQFSVDGTLLLDAFSLDRTRDTLSSTIDVIAYDRGIYLTRNSTYIRVEGETPESRTARLCKEFGIEIGTLAATGVPITRNFFGVSIYKIIMTMYSLASAQTGKKYQIRFRGAKLDVVIIEQSSESIRLKPGCNLLSATIKESASSMTNSVAIYDDDCNRISVQENAELKNLYGLMQAAIKASSYDDPVAQAKKILSENGLQTTITLNALGNVKLVTGNTVVVEEPITGTYGLFWIVSDTHTWKAGIYQTKVSLSLEAIMDSQEAGSVPTE